MKKFEYNCIEVVMDGSKDAPGLERFHKINGAVGWKLIDSFKTREACGSELRMFTYVREYEAPSPAEVKAAEEISEVLGPHGGPPTLKELSVFGVICWVIFVCWLIYVTSRV